jgi:hypothetical protein
MICHNRVTTNLDLCMSKPTNYIRNKCLPSLSCGLCAMLATNKE